MTVPVRVQRVVHNQLIQFMWAASEGSYDTKSGKYPQPGGYDTTVVISFEPLGERETLVRISEGGWRDSQGGLEGSYSNCQGWTHMACYLKAYLEYGINLRKGAH